MTHSGAEEPAENRRIQVPMNASPASALEVVPAQFFLDLAETSFHLPPCEGHAEQLAECPTPLSGDAIAEEVFRFTSEHVAR